MFSKFIVLAALLIFLSPTHLARAQNQETLSSMFECLHDTPLSSNDVNDCTLAMGLECYGIDPPGSVGEGDYTANDCFLASSDQIKLKMQNYLVGGWPDNNTTSHQLRRIAIEYAIKRSEIECAFSRDLGAAAYKPWLGEIAQSHKNFIELSESSCLFHYLSASYWIVIVHERIK